MLQTFIRVIVTRSSNGKIKTDVDCECIHNPDDLAVIAKGLFDSLSRTNNVVSVSFHEYAFPFTNKVEVNETPTRNSD